jgi:hypothetical protein
MESTGDAIVLNIKQINFTLGIARAMLGMPAGGFRGRSAAASILAPL